MIPFTRDSDMNKKLCNLLSPEDRDDCRLVCKKWATKSPDWQFMPDTLEKKYDAVMKNRGKIDRNLIFFNLIYENDLNAVEWLYMFGKKNIDVRIPVIDTLSMDVTMIALHNKSHEMMRLLCEMHPEYYNQNWKTLYKTITAPENLQLCLYPSNQRYLYPHSDRNFSFIPYIITTFSNSSRRLKQLYAQKIPTKKGQSILIKLCAKQNAFRCLSFLLTNKEAQQIIMEKQDNLYGNEYLFCFLEIALSHNHHAIMHTLIQSKLYDINDMIFAQNSTVLDQYNIKERANGDNAKIFLKSLGAKTKQELEQERKCTIQ
jgi:hypothetical protein